MQTRPSGLCKGLSTEQSPPQRSCRKNTGNRDGSSSGLQWNNQSNHKRPYRQWAVTAAHHGLSRRKSAENWPNFGHKLPGTRCNNTTQHGTSTRHDKRLRAQRHHKTTTRHGKRQARQEQQLKKHTLHCWNPITGKWLPQGGGKGNNFMHGMARPAGDLKLRHHSHWQRPVRPLSLNHQRCRWCECNTDKAKQPKRDKVFLYTTQSWGSVSAPPKYVGVGLHECVHMCRCVRACACVCMHERACMHVPACVRSTCACVCMHVRVCLHVCVCMHACSCAGAWWWWLLLLL